MKTLKSLCVVLAALALAPAVWGAAPAAPTGVTATTNNTRYVYLAWPKVDGAAYYVVYRYGGNSGQVGLEQFTTKTAYYTDTSCEAGVKIPYRVRAFNAAGEGGKYSAYVRGFRKILLEPEVGGDCSVNPLGNAGVAQALKVRCNYRWQASADSWIRLHRNAYERSNDATNLTFSLARNDTGAPRTGTIYLKAGQETATLKVVQGAVTVDAADGWAGDAANAVVEDPAPGDFAFIPNYTSGFVTDYDDTATGGSCLRSLSMVANQKAVVAWTLPYEGWKLRFIWRKDTTSGYSGTYAVYSGAFKSNGLPDLLNATELKRCNTTDWTEVTLDSGELGLGATTLFFVYQKYSIDTAPADSGFGYLDDMQLETSPRAITFVDPPVKYDAENDAYSLLIENGGGKRTVATEVTYSHTVTLGGETQYATALVYPDWTWLEKASYYFNDLTWEPGEDDASHLTTITCNNDGVKPLTMRAAYTVGASTIYRDISAIRNLAWTPLTYAGATLDGATAMWGGARETFTLVKHYTNTTQHVGADIPVTLDWDATPTITLGVGFENDSAKPDADWNGKNARVVLIRDSVEYLLVFLFSAS